MQIRLKVILAAGLFAAGTLALAQDASTDVKKAADKTKPRAAKEKAARPRAGRARSDTAHPDREVQPELAVTEDRIAHSDSPHDVDPIPAMARPPW